ncbi:MAG: [FeFe] hydrogenase H-cluster maturation GTPase HydF [Spirochaetaceae bacterium]|jgi:[FeFe] hydrogenase H-cluster maturation GTPase HydF|nr:[FeFe] hydrogenase H-cluster maturation GTPase HydF [Spirochaetaceae bacterium]
MDNLGLNAVPSANRVHIGFFGLRNAGKSSLLNAVAGQELAIVSKIKGTTTDPVFKAMEILPLGPVVIIDTPGIDDVGKLGAERVRSAKRVMNRIDIALLVTTAGTVQKAAEEELIRLFNEKEIPYLVVKNKCDTLSDPLPADGGAEIFVSAKTGFNINLLKERIAAIIPVKAETPRIIGDLISPSDIVILVTPIDTSAPKGRLILPQQQTIRDILEAGAIALVVKEYELKDALEGLVKKPRMVITDSQVFEKVSAEVPTDIPLSSFSILFARYKGFLVSAVKAVTRLDSIEDGDKILICEGCTHHRQCDDIGTVKIPRWIRDYTGKTPDFSNTAGSGFPDDLSEYKLIIHCGGCMLNEREMLFREKSALSQNAPMTNYGILIAHIQGILKRSLSVFPLILAELENYGGHL